MSIGRSLISFILILTYSIGFCHSIVPSCNEIHVAHSHNSEQDRSDHHHHEDHHHHASNETLNAAHAHIAHNDHFDNNVFELLVCALKESKHHHGPCDLDTYTPIHYFFDGIEKEIDRSPAITPTTYPESLVITSTANKYFTTNYCSTLRCAFLDDCRHRGPPLHS